MPVLSTCTSAVPVPLVPTLSVPNPDSLTIPSQTADDDDVFQLQSESTSERNFAVQLFWHMFTLSELAGRNVKGVGGKLQLNLKKINKI